MVRDTLADDGTLWLNLGTTYRDKQDVQIPARVALALQADGWILRADVIWWKPNAPPSSARDRPGLDYEHLFMLVKSPSYLYNREAVMEPAAWERWGKQTVPKYAGSRTATGWMQERSKEELQELGNGKKNLRSVWKLPTSNNASAHWAPFPAEIPRRCILASSNPGDLVLDPYCGSGTTLARGDQARPARRGRRHLRGRAGASEGCRGGCAVAVGHGQRVTPRVDSRATNGPAPPKRPGPGNGGTSSDAPETLSPVPRLTFREWREAFRMMRDKSYQQTRLGPDVVAYLAWKRLSRASERTLDQYERDLRLVCLRPSTAASRASPTATSCSCSRWSRGSRGSASAPPGATSSSGRSREGCRPDNPVDRLPKLRPTPEPVYDLWRQDELDLLVAGTRKMERPLSRTLRVLTMIESGCARRRASGDAARRLRPLPQEPSPCSARGSKRRLIPISAELVATVDEYLLTEYPAARAAPALTDYLWFRRLQDGRPDHRAEA